MKHRSVLMFVCGVAHAACGADSAAPAMVPSVMADASTASAPAVIPHEAGAQNVEPPRAPPSDAAVVAPPPVRAQDAGVNAPSSVRDAETSSGTEEAGISAMDASGPPSVDTAQSVLIPHPSWTCAMPNGVPPPELGTPAFTAQFAVSNLRDMGNTQYGMRKVLEFGSGTFAGPQLEASLMSGGYELYLALPNGAVELEQILMLKAKSGAAIYLRVCGLAASGSEDARVVMDFEAPNASFAKLNSAKLVGVRSLSADAKRLTLRVYDVSSVALPLAKVNVAEPAGLPEQSWECKTDRGAQGAELYRETVQIGSSVLVGDSKRGTRNVIPITGGTTTGKLKGKILPLGADFQLLGANFVIDARYVALTEDNELIIVRNCGALGALIPVFEARTAGPYAFINESRWLSSDPSVGLGSVSLTIYEKR